MEKKQVPLPFFEKGEAERRSGDKTEAEYGLGEESMNNS